MKGGDWLSTASLSDEVERRLCDNPPGLSRGTTAMLAVASLAVLLGLWAVVGWVLR